MRLGLSQGLQIVWHAPEYFNSYLYTVGILHKVTQGLCLDSIVYDGELAYIMIKNVLNTLNI